MRHRWHRFAIAPGGGTAIAGKAEPDVTGLYIECHRRNSAVYSKERLDESTRGK